MSGGNSLAAAAKDCDTIMISARYDNAAHTLFATQTVNYKNRSGDSLSFIKFHIYANAYRDGAKFPPVTASEISQAYPNGQTFGRIHIDKVRAAQTEVPALVEGDDQNVLSVPLTSPLRPNKSIEIFFEYTVELANIAHRLGWTENAVNLGNFYPVPVIYENRAWQTYPYSFNGDPFYNALHNFEVMLECDDADTKIAASGKLVRKSGDGRIHQFRAHAIRDFAMVLGKNFRTVSRTAGGVRVNYFYIDDGDPQQSLTCAVDTLRTFSHLFTKYPYEQLTVVQTDFLHGGMEYGELVYISADLLKKDSDDTGRAFHNQVITHEIAHQWWYGVVGNNQPRTAWIDEGLAEYSTLLFFDQNPQYAPAPRAEIIGQARDNFAAYTKLVSGIGGTVDTEMNRDLNSFRSPHEYVFMTYVRGMLLFCDLEMLLGRQATAAALGNFARENRFSFATQDKLITSLEKSTNAKLRTFFESFLSGAESL